MLADALPKATVPARQPWRRASVIAAVALVHFVFLYVLLHAVGIPLPPKLAKQEPITIWFLLQPKQEPQKKKPEPERQNVEQPSPPEVRIAPITLPPPRIPKAPSSNEDGLGKLGRYLNNCSQGNYGKLNEKEWDNCLGGAATQDNKDGTIRLGDVRTLWEKQHPLPPPANPADADGFVECAHGTPQAHMGIPCFQHTGQRPSVLNGQQ